jgi:hypothetical protein
MKRHAALLLWLVGTLVAAFGADGPEADFSRYNLILERKPFGVPPVEAAPEEGAPVPPDSFATYVRLTALMQEEGGRVRVGFVDKRQKDKSYMLSVGEKADDYEVLEADVEAEVAKLRKGTEEQWLSMKIAGAVTAPETGGRVRGPRPPPSSVQVPAILLSGASTNSPRRTTRYAAIRRAELEREKMAEEVRKLEVYREPPDEEDEEDEVVIVPPGSLQVDEDEDEDEDAEDEVVIPLVQPDEDDEDEEDEDDAIREAEINGHLQNYQMELIKQGLPPLPIPLTPESDAKLVDEGVLEPLPAETDED